MKFFLLISLINFVPIFGNVKAPYVQFPSQGYPPNYYFPQTELQTHLHTLHHDNFMTQPQPQRNPPAPKAHQMPGSYSTIPQMQSPIK